MQLRALTFSLTAFVAAGVVLKDGDDDYYVGQQNTADTESNPLIFDCGSSGTKNVATREKIKPTMSDACDKDKCKPEYSKLDVSKNGNCFAVATAGNRIIKPEKDRDAWTGFKKTLKNCTTWMETPNCFFSQKDSYTIAGVQEALYEAHLVQENKNRARGFVSAGGASGQFGFQLCANDTVIDEWNKFRNVSFIERLWTLQCHNGTEIDAKHFIGQTTEANVRKADGADLHKSEHVAAADSWVLGSFLGCNGSYSEFSGLNEAYDAFQRSRGHVDMNKTGVNLWLRSDGALSALRDFTRSWKNGCPAYFKEFVTTAQMKRGDSPVEKKAKVISDEKNEYHGAWASIMTRGVLSFLELAPQGAKLRNVGGNWIELVAKLAVKP